MIIYVTPQVDGFVFSLHPRSRKRLFELEPDARLAQRLSIGYDTASDFQRLQGSLKRQVAALVGGLAAGEAARDKWGSVEFRDSRDDSVMATWDPMNPND